MPIFARNVPLVFLIFLKRSLDAPILLLSSYIFALMTEEGFLISPSYSLEICLKGRQLGEVSRCGHSIKLRHIGITTTMLRQDQQRQDGNILGNSSPLRPVSEKSQIPQFIPILYYIARLYYEMEHCFSQLSCDSEFPGTPNNVQKPGPLSYFKEPGPWGDSSYPAEFENHYMWAHDN